MEQDQNIAGISSMDCEETSIGDVEDVSVPSVPSFQIDRNKIQSVALEEQSDELKALGITVYDQSKFEEGILQQVDDALEKQERLTKTRKKKLLAPPSTIVDGAPVAEKEPQETEREKLIRQGHMTPFGTVVNGRQANKEGLSSFERYLQQQAYLQNQKKGQNPVKGKKPKPSTSTSTSTSKNTVLSCRPQQPKASTSRKRGSDSDEYVPSEDEAPEKKKKKKPDAPPRTAKQGSSQTVKSKPREEVESSNEDGGTDDSDWDYSAEEEEEATSRKRKKSGSSKVIDDGNVKDYKERLANWHADDHVDCHELEGGYRIPLSIWDNLYNYQKVGVQWMYELRMQRCGGILGDEMGLGKTIQVVAFLAGLAHSRLLTRLSMYRGLGPVLLVVPATVMHQWTKEFHKWWPPLRIAILHESGSHAGSKEALIKSINNSNGILITSYSGVVNNSQTLLGLEWDYVILDEGHKIRNPDAQATLVLKQFRTCNRFILSGSPMQNNLKELWSLFDFVFPGKLGTLPVFLQQFAVPITHGGYANASQVQVATAYKCATVLKETIDPYLLRRMKADVKDHLSLPSKNEQVLFCRLTTIQREMYQNYLDSGEIKNIVDGRLQIFVGLTKLRKICNHPDLFIKHQDEDTETSCVQRSGKMVVVDNLLQVWKKQNHRVLLFSQSRKMLDMLETHVRSQNYTYMRLDGTTSIGSRQPMIEKFNQDDSIFVFLLTTKVGGLGVNLTGANRVIIYDPDWNPSTDTQARERSWRIGQLKDVTIYRLLTSGTIEEKIYHRQIFKQYLTNRVLKDPKQRRFFKSNDLYELFTLKDTDNQCTETEAIFAGAGGSDFVESNPHCPHGSRTQPSQKEKDDEWMLQWKRQREKREAEWKKKLEKEKRKEELKALNETAEEKRARKKREAKEKKERKRVEIDGAKVKNVKKMERYLPANPDVENESSTQSQDDYVLQRLFAKTGVLSALRHDSIVGAGDPDYALIEGEAERVAKAAVRELQSSRQRCWTAEAGIPTWTGTSGGIRPNPPAEKRRFGTQKKSIAPVGSESSPSTSSAAQDIEGTAGPSSLGLPFGGSKGPLSSKDLLHRMQSRNRLLGVPTSSDGDDEDNSGSLGTAGEEESRITSLPSMTASAPLDFATGVDYQSMMEDIRSYVAFRGLVPGQATTTDLLEEFNGKLPPRGAPLFRALLGRLCTFTRDVNGQGVWQLKTEFR